MSVLAERIVLLHRSLRRAGIPHAFGGALALAYCTEQARGTLDIDINVFLGADDLRRLESALPDGVRITPAIRKLLVADGQARVLWERIPVDVFLNTTPFHTLVAGRIAWHRFGRLQLPFLTCSDLAVFKAFFSRAKDWVDLEEMQRAGVLDIESVCTVLAEYLGPTDERIDRLRSLG
jgi:hypothetical protein